MSLCAIAIVCVQLLGCSPQSRYKTLRVLFDGVPDPDAPKVDPYAARRGTNSKPLFIHRPYAQEKCDACHINTDDIFARAKVRANVCIECHAKIKTEHAIMHGPVVNDACTLCHVPHTSPNEHLLRVPAPKVCIQCHESGSLTASIPEHLDAKASCLTCHSGHGGADHQMLKLVRAAPATAPAAKPTTGNGGRT
jgi:predicted CXXCH cytochrome family protein